MAEPATTPEAIVAEALRIGTLRERYAFVTRACGTNSELHAQVTQMLEQAEATRTFGNSDSEQHRDSAGDLTLLSGPADWGQTTVLPDVPGYEILGILGRGGMGVVYKARQISLNRSVALKMVLATQADREGLSRFRAEAHAAARLQHPNIVQIYEVGDFEGQPYIAFEFIEGGTLSDYILHTTVGQEEAAEIVENLARAMHYAHGQGIVHRDLKPGNILLSRMQGSGAQHSSKRTLALGSSRSGAHLFAAQTAGNLLPKISDFGLAKQLDAEGELTRTGAVLGTPNYMAPEQAEGDPTIGPATDVYSLGAILYTLITQRPPFRGKSSLETIQMVCKTEAVAPRKLEPKIPRDLETICLKCLEKKPEMRYASAEALAEDLRRYLDGEAILARPASLLYKANKLAHRHWNRVVVASFTLLIVVASIVVGLWISDAAQRRAQEVRLLSDIQLLAELKVEQPQLLAAPYSTRRELIESWIGRAATLTQMLPTHRAHLQAVSATAPAAIPRDEAGTASSAPAQQTRQEQLTQLVQGIEELGIAGGLREQVEGWAPLIPFPTEIDSAWNKARTAIEDTLGLRLEGCDGLYPLGVSSHSQLWEFVDVRYGLAPARDESGRLVIRPETGLVFVLLPGGRFRMGSPDQEEGRKGPGEANEQLHEVELSPFLISKYEVTQAQWEKIVGQNPSEHLGAIRAVHEVSWFDCDRFCHNTGLSLPTEAQWEYACRAGVPGPYNVSGDLDTIGWYVDNSFDAAHFVGEKRPNAFGLYDMHGNVLEWCRDVFAGDFYLRPEASLRDPVCEGSGQDPNEPRVLRGGSYEGLAEYLRSADRYSERPERRWRGFGLRPVWPAKFQPR